VTAALTGQRGRAGLLVAGLGLAVAARSVVGAADPRAALLFAALLTVVSWLSGWRPARPGPAWWGWGLVGAAGLVAGPLLRGAPRWHPGGFGGWAVVVTAVVVGEEVLLRGALWQALQPRLGVAATIGVTAALFAVVHLPLYGARALPLDVMAGVWLGVIRWGSGTLAAPAMAHLLADWAGWWLA